MKNSVSVVIIVVLASIIFIQHSYYSDKIGNMECKTETVVDTFYFKTTDTIRVTDCKIEKDTVTDTVYIETGGRERIDIPISQRYYTSDKYRIWISGYKPVLDSVYVFNDKEYITVNKKVTERIYLDKTRFYVNGGACFIDGNFMPKVGMTVTTPKKMMFGADLGLYKKKLTYSINIGYRL